MKKTVLFGALAAVGLTAGMASAGTLEDVKAKGELACGVSTGSPGFSFPDANGRWQGFDVGYCRALAGAVLGDGDAVKFKKCERGFFHVEIRDWRLRIGD